MFGFMEEMSRTRREEIRREYRETNRGHRFRFIRNLWKRLQKPEHMSQGEAGCPVHHCCVKPQISLNKADCLWNVKPDRR
ncbi:hypothetical protein C8P63_108115 [Melghirimyces profundicolus]|uniref:Uncharacterized protein n=1 Tax=Melghirimyces profundicolus TaxID=1242148 RepID=A0A2T6BXL6_9BACL|nr:hypothetical protein C8P63_108115 [Melghirimyces profundicolus]